MPQFFGNERHERMQNAQKFIENSDNFIVSLAINGLLVRRFHYFEEAGAEVVPNKFIDSHQRIRQTVLVEMVVHFGQHLIQAHIEPLDRSSTGLWLGDIIIHLPALNQTESIPNLVIEVSSLLAQRLVEQQVIASG